MSRVPQHLGDGKQALAIDLLTTIFQILGETSKRLEKKIADITRFQNLEAIPLVESTVLKAQMSLLDYNREPEQVLMRTALAEAWAIIDYVHRIGELLPLADVLLNKAHEELFKRIKLVRNSYQHNSERLNEYFVNGGSVFGNLSWQFQNAQNTSTVVLYPSISPNNISSGNFNNAVRQVAATKGISLVKLHFVTKETMKSSVTDEELSLDDIAEMINDMIGRMESTYQQIIDWADTMQRENPEASVYSRMPPMIMVTTRNNTDMHPDPKSA